MLKVLQHLLPTDSKRFLDCFHPTDRKDWKDKDMIVKYIKNQKEHHKSINFDDELRRLLKDYGVEVNEKYFP
jgi:hypothetical protein